MAKGRPLTVEVTGDELRISIGISTLAWAAEHSPDERLCWYDADSGEYLSFPVTDELRFAKDVVDELLTEDEEGTTAVHLMLDRACLNAIENGSLGVGEDPTPVNFRRNSNDH